MGWGSPKDCILSSCYANIFKFSHSCDQSALKLFFLVYFLLPESSIWVCNLPAAQSICDSLAFIAVYCKAFQKKHIKKECSFLCLLEKGQVFLHFSCLQCATRFCFGVFIFSVMSALFTAHFEQFFLLFKTLRSFYIKDLVEMF